jgi:succinyl-diaminopimelate desuccinylase
LDFVESCRRFISIDSSPSQGNAELAKFAAKLCTSKGLYCELLEETWGDLPQANVIARPTSVTHQDADEIETFLLQTHLDTQDPGPFGLWTSTDKNPYNATIVDGKIFGLGTADVKLDFLCKLWALSEFSSDTNWKRIPILIGTYGEETGMPGALKLIRKNRINAKLALIGEPSNLQLITSGKGIATVEINIPFEDDEQKYRLDHNFAETSRTQSKIFHGTAAHSSNPALGDSAILKVIDYLKQLPNDITVIEIDGGINFNTIPAHAFVELDLVSGYKIPMATKLLKVFKTLSELDNEFLVHQDLNFSPPHPTLSIGMIRTSESRVLISGNCRITPSLDSKIYDSWMQKLNRICIELGGAFQITDYKRAFNSKNDSFFVKGSQEILAKLGGLSSTITQPSTNEASLFSRVGIECICFGPGMREKNIHTPHEHVEIEDLRKAILFYKHMIERFCL